MERRLKKAIPEIMCVKFALKYRNGWPDSGYFTPGGKTVWVEHKVHPNGPTPLQTHTIKELHDRGHIVAIITQHPKHVTIEIPNKEPIICTTPDEWLIKHLKVN